MKDIGNYPRENLPGGVIYFGVNLDLRLDGRSKNLTVFLFDIVLSTRFPFFRIEKGVLACTEFDVSSGVPNSPVFCNCVENDPCFSIITLFKQVEELDFPI